MGGRETRADQGCPQNGSGRAGQQLPICAPMPPKPLSSLFRMAAVESVEYGDEYITAVAVADAKTRGVLAAYELK